MSNCSHIEMCVECLGNACDACSSECQKCGLFICEDCSSAHDLKCELEEEPDAVDECLNAS